MKTRNRIILAALVGFMAAVGTGIGASQAKAAPPEWPTCVRAAVDSDSVRVWLNPGTLYNPNTAAVNGVKLDRRRDDIFTGIVDKPEPYLNGYVKFSFNGSKNAVWVKCKKVTP